VISFNPNESVDIEALHLKKTTCRALDDNLMMFYTGLQRKTSTILTEQRSNMQSQKKFTALQHMVEMVWELRDALYSGDLSEFGEILDRNWQLKQQLASKISNEDINALYTKAMTAGATGGKILGAGGGGFLLMYCEKEKQDRVREALSSLRELKFHFDNEGSKLIYVGDEYT